MPRLHPDSCHRWQPRAGCALQAVTRWQRELEHDPGGWPACEASRTAIAPPAEARLWDQGGAPATGGAEHPAGAEALADGRGQRHRRFGRALAGAIAENPARELV